MSSKNTVMKFKNYSVEKITYLKNDFYKSDEESVGFPKIAIRIIRDSNNKNKFNMILGAKYDQESNFPYLLEVVLRGFFETMNELETDNSKLDCVLANGSAIMYPYIRAVFTEMTSKSDYNPVILPTVNFYEYVKELHEKSEDFLMDSKYYKEYED